MICVSVDETDDGLNSKTEEVSGGNWREHWIGKIVRSGLEEKMKELKRAGLNE